MMTTRIRTALVALALFSAPATAMASPETDLLFATPHFAGAAEGAVLLYDHEMRTDADGAKEAERIELTLGPADAAGVRAVDITIDAGDLTRHDRLDGMPGNPVLMIFLEGVVKSVGDSTGGSPFYLRNRIKDALRDGIVRSGEGSGDGAEVLTIRPFDGDSHRAELGPYAGLKLDFVVDRAAPGMLTRMTARAGDGAHDIYFEEIRLADGG